jgi:hypothetical protein
MVNVFIAGDSTVQTFSKERAPQAGWGQYIGAASRRTGAWRIPMVRILML